MKEVGYASLLYSTLRKDGLNVRTKTRGPMLSLTRKP